MPIKHLSGSQFAKQLKQRRVMKINFSKRFKNHDKVVEIEGKGFAAKGLQPNTRYEYFVSDGEKHGMGEFVTSPHENSFHSIAGIDFNPTIIYIFEKG